MTPFRTGFNRTERTRRSGPISLDIVIPVYNEEASLPYLFDTLDRIFNRDVCQEYGMESVRYLFIDDGSSDTTLETLLSRTHYTHPVRVIALSRRFGHQCALTAGLDFTDTDLTALIDADLQDPPHLILDMIRKWREGFDVIYAQRAKRKEGIFKRAAYWSFYRLYKIMSPIQVPLDSGDFCLMSREVIQALRTLPEHLRFHRGLRSWVGFNQTGLVYDRPARCAGSTKYTFQKLYKLGTDGIASLSITPLRFSQFFALVFCLISMLFIVLLPLSLSNFVSIQMYEMAALTVLITGNVVSFFALYILGAYIGRMYWEIKGRPAYIVKHIFDLPGD